MPSYNFKCSGCGRVDVHTCPYEEKPSTLTCDDCGGDMKWFPSSFYASVGMISRGRDWNSSTWDVKETKYDEKNYKKQITMHPDAKEWHEKRNS